MYWHSIWYLHHKPSRQDNLRITGDIDELECIRIIFQFPWTFFITVPQKIKILIPSFAKYTFIPHHCAYSLGVN
jgi:hypothetical protein